MSRNFNGFINPQEFRNAVNEKAFRVLDEYEYHCTGGRQNKNGMELYFVNVDDDRDVIVGKGKTLDEVSENLRKQVSEMFNL